MDSERHSALLTVSAGSSVAFYEVTPLLWLLPGVAQLCLFGCQAQEGENMKLVWLLESSLTTKLRGVRPPTETVGLN